MSDIRDKFVSAAITRSHGLTDFNIHNDIHKRHEFRKQTIHNDNTLTKFEKIEAIKWLNKEYDREKILKNSGKKRICENCKEKCLGTLYCEYCIRNHLKSKFLNWSSGNNNIDNLIQKCQMEILHPQMIIEWIPFNKLQNIKCLTKDGYSDIYTADWIGGCYKEWDIKIRQLKRVERPGIQNLITKVVLKKLENIESANQSWFDEAKSHLSISNKHSDIVKCYGLTQDISNRNYMLVMDIRDIDLRKYLQQNHNKLNWKQKINITFEIIRALYVIHKENSIHKNLHSGNILYSQLNNQWYISDLGFSGPANKPSSCIYGNLPYIAPEVIKEIDYTFKSDIYSIGILMWEISSGHPPFINYGHNYNLAINIINGIRPKVTLKIPVEYKNLMEQCWDANPLKRPDLFTLMKKIREMNSYYQGITDDSVKTEMYDDLKLNKASNSINSKLFTSKIYQFENLPEPRNATEDEIKVNYMNIIIKITIRIIKAYQRFLRPKIKS
ncbi:Ipl1p [Rhizophagus irregularis DAOM 197198w]|uniref:Ipl1p n=2 Tax=Rhizophagus irregularis TaxID=588596 RepID=A0A015KB19_RHIIW|nr:Ipl1p [Rhizophagus irregularis DAOM 197198w]